MAKILFSKNNLKKFLVALEVNATNVLLYFLTFVVSAFVIEETRNRNALIDILDSGYSNEFTKYTLISLSLSFFIMLPSIFVRNRLNLYSIFAILLLISFLANIYFYKFSSGTDQIISVTLFFLFSLIFHKLAKFRDDDVSSCFNFKINNFLLKFFENLVGVVFYYSIYLIFYFTFKFYFDKCGFNKINNGYFCYAFFFLFISTLVKSIIDSEIDIEIASILNRLKKIFHTFLSSGFCVSINIFLKKLISSKKSQKEGYRNLFFTFERRIKYSYGEKNSKKENFSFTVIFFGVFYILLVVSAYYFFIVYI